MTTQEQIRKVTDIAQEKGWSISVEDENKTSIQFEFQRYTKYGQDFNFNADMQDEDIDTLIAGMKRYYEDFDPDYEAYLWIGRTRQKWRTLSYQGYCSGYGRCRRKDIRVAAST